MAPPTPFKAVLFTKFILPSKERVLFSEKMAAPNPSEITILLCAKLKSPLQVKLLLNREILPANQFSENVMLPLREILELKLFIAPA